MAKWKLCLTAIMMLVATQQPVRSGVWDDWIKKPDVDGLFEGATEQVEKFSADIATILPQLERLGFSISTFRMQLLPPIGKLRLTSRIVDRVDPNPVEVPAEATWFVRSILAAAVTAKNVQSMMKLELVVMDVELGLTPGIKFSYLKEIGPDDFLSVQLQDLDLACGQALN